MEHCYACQDKAKGTQVACSGNADCHCHCQSAVRLRADCLSIAQVAAAGHRVPPDEAHDADIAQLQEEINLLRLRVESHPEVKRFAGTPFSESIRAHG